MSILSFFTNNSSTKVGTPPGTVVYIGEPRTHQVSLSVYRYNEQKLYTPDETASDGWTLQHHGEEPWVSWINIDGIHDSILIKEIGQAYQLHPLILEDIANTTQRPKLEEYDNGFYLVLKMISYKKETKELDIEQVSLYLGQDYVLTFQEKPEDVLDPIRTRLQKNQGRLRKKGADYLFYALVDVIISNYFLALEGIEDQINELEERINEDVSMELIQDIQRMKKTLIFLNKSVFPLREVIGRMERLDELNLIHPKTILFFRDLQDQLFHILDLAETFKDILSNLHDLHLALNGHKMNQVMKVLTIVSTIFIPLTFIAGIYGMNFQFMPELSWKNGYFLVWGLMGMITVGLLVLFKKKSWL